MGRKLMATCPAIVWRQQKQEQRILHFYSCVCRNLHFTVGMDVNSGKRPSVGLAYWFDVARGSALALARIMQKEHASFFAKPGGMNVDSVHQDDEPYQIFITGPSCSTIAMWVRASTSISLVNTWIYQKTSIAPKDQ